MITTILTYAAVFIRIIANPAGNVFQKKLTHEGNHPLMVNFNTYLLLSILCVLLALNTSWPELSTPFWIYALLGGAVGAMGNGFLIKALQKGELSVLGPINAYKSIVGLITGIFLLGEMPNIWGIAGMLLIVYGSYFVLDTTEERFSWALLQKSEIQFRIWAMILTAIEAVFIKKVILASSTTIAFFSWCWFGAFFSFLLLLIFRVNVSGQFSKSIALNYKWYGFLVICMGTMQFTTNYAFDHMPVGYALSLFQLSTIVSVLLGYKVFKEEGIRKKLIGSMIMILGSVIIILLNNG